MRINGEEYVSTWLLNELIRSALMNKYNINSDIGQGTDIHGYVFRKVTKAQEVDKITTGEGFTKHRYYKKSQVELCIDYTIENLE